MPRFGKRSLQVRATLHPKLSRIFDEAIMHFDFKLVEGFRHAKRQHELFLAGKSMKDYPDSKHNKCPSEAVDAYPHPINWGDRERMIYFAGIVMGIAQIRGIKLRWGGDWDNDTEVLDNIFDDLGHFELIDT